jgi:hypothetical protein
MGARTSSINYVHLFGRVDSAPKISFTAERTKVGEFFLTTWDEYKNATGWVKEIDTFRVKAFNSSADVIEAAVRQGCAVAIVGKLKLDARKIVIVATRVIAMPGVREDEHHHTQPALTPRSYTEGGGC